MELCIALDMPSASENLNLVESLGEYDGLWMKVALEATSEMADIS